MTGLTTQSAERGEGFQPGGNVGDGVGVDGAATALVSGVERREQVGEFRAADLPQHHPVGAHPEGLPHQGGERDRSFALVVGGSALHAHTVRVSGGQFPGVLHHDDPFRCRHLGQQRRQQRGLAGPGATGDQERHLPGDHPPAQLQGFVGERPGGV